MASKNSERKNNPTYFLFLTYYDIFSLSGGSLNGKDCEKVLESALNAKSLEECPIMKCLLNGSEEKAEKFMKLFKVLANVWSTMRMPNDNLDDEDISEIVSYCQEWGKLLPVLFPERNITRKGHALSIHIPEYLEKFRTYYRYYKLEQMGESIHATMNSIGRKLAPIRPKSRRLWKIVEQYEMMNHVDTSLIAKKKKQTGKTMASTILTTIGVLALCALL
jgi:hypothetical protein